MVMKCFYCGEKFNAGSNRSFHQFPLRNPEILQLWLKAMGFDSNLRITEKTTLCSDHFDKKCIRTGVHATLVEGSVPSIFGPHKSACVYCKKTKKDSHLTFHKFPHENEVLLQKWLEAMGSNIKITKMSILCSDHFKAECFRAIKSGSSRRLKHNAIPTIFSETTAIPVKTSLKRRIFDTSPLTDVSNTKYLKMEATVASNASLSVEKENFDAKQHALKVQNVPLIERTTSGKCNLGVIEKFQNSPCAKSSIEEIRNSDQYIETSGIAEPCIILQTEAKSPERSTVSFDLQQQSSVLDANSIRHDHHYENSPRTLRRQLRVSREKIQVLRNDCRVKNQRINRMNKTITSLKEIIYQCGVCTDLMLVKLEDNLFTSVNPVSNE